MSNNDLVRVDFGITAKPNDQIIYKDLNAQAANIIGTAFKGPAFVPQILFNSTSLNGIPVRNTLIKTFGTHRQNYRSHLFDDYLCYADSEAYDAASTWFAGGGEYAYFTRVLGIGSGIRSATTGKMIGSGFNLSKNISSGTLDNKIGRNINSVEPANQADSISGSVGFVVRKINELGKENQSDDFSTPNFYLDYLSELGIPDNAFVLTDVYMFDEGIIPDLTKDDAQNIVDNTHVVFDNNINHMLNNINNADDVFIKLRNFNKYQKELVLDNNGELIDENISVLAQVIRPIKNNYKIGFPLVGSNITETNIENYFFENFRNRGHISYARFPAFEINDKSEEIAILNTKKYPVDVEVDYPDYNSFECEYQTAKTPWVTSQPLDRTNFGIINNNDDNRLDIHNKVINLFKFHALDSGEIGNRFRIKINTTNKGNTSYVKPNRSDTEFTRLAAESDFYAKFDVYIFEYDPRENKFINLDIPGAQQEVASNYVESFKDLNLNPDSDNYIARVIGTEHTFYDFDSDMLIIKGKYKNRSNYLRIEMHEDIELKKYDTYEGATQHMLLPSGFRSYPHIELKRSAFSHYESPNMLPNSLDLDSIFVNNGVGVEKVYHMPPVYALHYYRDHAIPDNEEILNNWGVIFTPTTADQINNPNIGWVLDRDSSFINGRDDSNELVQKFLTSPHFYYTKYFISGIEELNDEGKLEQSLTKNVWIEEDNYLNSFFHLEKIVFKNVLNQDQTNYASSFIDNERKDISYKHSGRNVEAGYEYINLDDNIWEKNDSGDFTGELKDKFRNKLSFDFFTYGGFDGVDLRDNDKRLLRNDAAIREISGEEEGSETNGATYNSYKKAIEVATDDAYATADVLVVPGIKEIPLIRQCVKACEDSQTQDMFFIGDVSGACSSVDITFANQTTQNSNGVYVSKPVKVAKGVMGNYKILDSNLNNQYTRDSSKILTQDNRFILTDLAVPIQGDVLSFYNYKKVVKSQFENILSLWPTFFIESKNFLPVLGDVKAVDSGTEFNKRIGPEVFTLGLLARNGLRDSLVNSNAPSFLESSTGLSMSLFDDVNLNAKNVNFEINSKKAKEAGINLLYKNTEGGTDTIKLLSQNTAYEERGSIFKDQGAVRTIQQIKKRIKFDLFLNQQLVEGGFFFGQNSNSSNMHQKLDIQLNNILNEFVSEGLITDYKVNVPSIDDDKAILDMQNYIIRGNIILQLSLSDTIDITLDEILQDLSLTADPVNGAVLVPSIP